MRKDITIATLNINGLLSVFQPPSATGQLAPQSLRHKEICKWFEQSSVDLINFQEVFTYRNLYLLRKNLPSYPYVSYRPFLFGPRGALVTFSKTPLMVESYTSFFWPSLKVDRSKSPRGSLLRSSLKGILVTRAKGLPLTVINTHILYNADLDWKKGSRSYGLQKVQLNEIANVANSQNTTRPEGVLVLAGDLNVEVGSGLLKEFLAKAKLQDLFAKDTSPTFHNEYVSPPGFKSRIDYILVNDRGSVLGTQRIFEDKVQLDGRSMHVSDHQGLQSTIDIVTEN